MDFSKLILIGFVACTCLLCVCKGKVLWHDFKLLAKCESPCQCKWFWSPIILGILMLAGIIGVIWLLVEGIVTVL